MAKSRQPYVMFSGLAILVSSVALLLGGDAEASSTSQHIVNKSAHISFYASPGFVHQAIASFYEVSDYNRNVGVQILIQNAAGAVSIADGDSFLTNWLVNTDLTFGKAKYVREGFGRVADLVFSNLPSGDLYRLYGRDLRFSDGSRSFDVVVDSPSSAATVRATNLLPFDLGDLTREGPYGRAEQAR